MGMNLDEMIGDARSIAIAGHVRPDGDCVGSCLGVYNYITSYHPDAKAQVFLDPIQDVFEFLSGSDSIKRASENDVESYDLFICLDCGVASRLGAAAEIFDAAKRTVCIDHHMSNEDFADINYVFPKASSTCELVSELVDNDRITKEIAECLYVGLVHDTGVFQFSCTHESTMQLAGKLMTKGIDYSNIIDKTFYEMTLEQNRILGYALLKMEKLLDGKVLATYLTLADMAKYGATAQDTDSIVNQIRKTRGCELVIFLYENEDGSFKGSLRSNVDINLVDIVQIYDGGGHRKAAGFTARGDIEKEIIPAIIDKFKEIMNYQ